MELKEALKQLKESEKKKFNQSIDLVINLKGIDLKRNAVSTVVNIPHKFKEKKVCGFLTKKSNFVHTITQPEFIKYRDKDELKSLVKEYDFFIAAALLMPAVATTFGKVLGPVGKMPSPQLGILTQENEETVKQLLDKISQSIKIRAKEPSIKLSVGKENMKEEDIIANINAVYKAIADALPNKKENIKSVMVKLTMSKPIKVEMK